MTNMSVLLIYVDNRLECTMVEWEYKTFEWQVLKHALDESQKPENLGGQGWELVSTDYDIDFRVWVLMFKRPKQ